MTTVQRSTADAATTLRPPRGFRRVDLSDLDHLGFYVRSRGEWREYWHPENPSRVRQEKFIGLAGRVVRMIDLDLRPRERS